MAGGIFTNQPFQFNTKCVVFGGVLGGAYWWLGAPQYRSMLGLGAVFVLSYIAMAWYDWYYECPLESRLKTGANGPVGYIDSIWKPWDNGADETVLAPSRQCDEYVRHVWLFQGLVTAPLLIALVWQQQNWTALSVISIVLSLAQIGFMVAHSSSSSSPKSDQLKSQ